MLRSNDLIWNVAINRYLLGRDAPAFDLLYWNSDATRLPAKMHREYLENMYARNALARGELSVAGTRRRLTRREERRVRGRVARRPHRPLAFGLPMTQLFSGDTRFRLGHSGHIAGIINAPGAG